MLFHLLSKPVFTPSQLERFSNIFDNAGQVFLAVMVLTPLVEGNPWVLALGVLDMLACWTGSIILSRKKDIEK